MSHNLKVREDVVTSIALRLKRNMLSADEFQRELNAMTRQERASLVEYLDRIEKCPEERNRHSAVA
jgi:hypothetical protein